MTTSHPNLHSKHLNRCTMPHRLSIVYQNTRAVEVARNQSFLDKCIPDTYYEVLINTSLALRSDHCYEDLYRFLEVDKIEIINDELFWKHYAQGQVRFKLTDPHGSHYWWGPTSIIVGLKGTVKRTSYKRNYIFDGGDYASV